MKVMDRIAIAAAAILILVLALAGFAAIGGTKDGIEGAIGIFIAGAIYLFPVLTARQRHVPHIGSIAVVNVLLGWTIIGWVIALAMALRDPRPVA